MAEGARIEQWDHTASINTLIANCHRDAQRRRRPYGLQDFHPYRDEVASGGLKIRQENKEILRQIIQSRTRRKPSPRMLTYGPQAITRKSGVGTSTAA